MRTPTNNVKLTVALAFVVCGLTARVQLARPTHDSARAPLSKRAVPFTPDLPEGIPLKLWRESIPPDNPMTGEKVALGQSLYFDKRLSADGTVSCATCHDPATAFADNRPLAVGVNSRVGVRNAPTVLNAMFSRHLFWDGRARSLEEQAVQPLFNPSEMGMPDSRALVERLEAAGDYRRRFAEVFGPEGITAENVARALAAYERTQLSGGSPFDRFIAGDEQALTEAQQRGWRLFRNKAQCIACHTFSAAAPFFTDFKFHNTGAALRGTDLDRLARGARPAGRPAPGARQDPNFTAHAAGLSELGRYAVTKRSEDLGAFKTPTLRDVELTAPYMHDGSEKTLLDVVRFYDRGGEKNARLDRRMRPLGLSEQEMSDLVEFLRALTSDDVVRQAQTARPQTRTPVLSGVGGRPPR